MVTSVRPIAENGSRMKIDEIMESAIEQNVPNEKLNSKEAEILEGLLADAESA